MDISKLNLTKEQLDIAIKVGEEAQRQGINPDFVLPMIYHESGFKQDAISKKGALGVMQLMPKTAKDLKVDPNDMDQNIRGGISLLKELISNPKIGNDPYKVIAGYNTSTETRDKFYASGDFKDLPKETLDHMINITTTYNGDLPKATFEAQANEAPAPEPEEAPYQSAAETKRLQQQNLAAGPVYKENQNSPVMAGAVGAGLGATVGESAAILNTQKEAADLAYNMAKNAITGKKVVPEVSAGETPGGKWGAKTGYGVGEGTVEDVNAKYKRMKPQGKISGRMAERYGIARPGESADLVQRMIDRQNLAEASALEANAASKTMPLSWAKKLISYPLKGAIGGFGLLAGAQDVYNRNDIGAKGEALASGLSSLAGAASPYVAGVAGPLLGGGALATQLMLSAKDRDRYLQQHPEAFMLEDTDVDPMGNRIR